MTLRGGVVAVEATGVQGAVGHVTARAHARALTSALALALALASAGPASAQAKKSVPGAKPGAAAAAAAPAPAAPAGPSYAERFGAVCAACHGADLAGGQQVPRIGGQKEEYLRQTLQGFKNGTRPGYTRAMTEALSQVPEADIDTLAYFAAHGGGR